MICFHCCDLCSQDIQTPKINKYICDFSKGIKNPVLRQLKDN